MRVHPVLRRRRAEGIAYRGRQRDPAGSSVGGGVALGRGGAATSGVGSAYHGRQRDRAESGVEEGRRSVGAEQPRMRDGRGRGMADG